MRKGWLVAALVGATLFGGALVAYAGEDVHKSLDAVFKNIGIKVDGKLVQSTKEPFIVDGSTYVSARTVAEALYAKVGWDGQNVLITSRDGFVKAEQEAGDLFSFPGRGGASLLLPKGATVGTKANIIMAADTQAGPILVMRLDSPGLDLNKATTVISAVIQAFLPDYQAASSKDATVQGKPAKDLAGYMGVLPVRGRVVDDGTNLWAVLGIGGADSVQPIIDTFTWREEK